jgi:hypothetical protein
MANLRFPGKPDIVELLFQYYRKFGEKTQSSADFHFGDSPIKIPSHLAV